jgi:alpha-1,6-mannosyltransferase
VAAEARASGLPLIVPDRGGAADQVAEGAGMTYQAGQQRSLEQAILSVAERGLELQRAAAVRASKPRTMEEHFADLFERYAEFGRRGGQTHHEAAEAVAGAA